MTSEEVQKLPKYITGITEIFYKNIPSKELVTVETLQKSVREQMFKKVNLQVEFFLKKARGTIKRRAIKLKKLSPSSFLITLSAMKGKSFCSLIARAVILGAGSSPSFAQITITVPATNGCVDSGVDVSIGEFIQFSAIG